MHKMTRLRNAFVAFFACAVLIGPTLLCGAELLKIAVPEQLTSVPARNLAGNFKPVHIEPVFNLDGVLSGELQTVLGKKIEDYFIPAKAPALRVNAGIQRSFIEVSNALFGWECYPSFYSTSVLCVPSEERLMECPMDCSEDMIVTLMGVQEKLEAFSLRSSVPVALYVAPTAACVDGSPAASLMSDPLTYSEYRSIFGGKASSYLWVDGGVSYESFLADWYRTDHHWTASGGYAAYWKIAEALELDDRLVPESDVIFPEPWFYGSFARRALCDRYHDLIQDYVVDYPAYRIEFNGTEVSFNELVGYDDYELGLYPSAKYDNRYGDYYHYDYASITIENLDSRQEGELLIIGDSYTNSIERFFASSFKNTYTLDYREVDQTASEFMIEHPDITQVLILVEAEDLREEPFSAMFT